MSDQDPWHSLRKLTAARIALGRAGGSLPTRELLEFSFAHAEARDAVHTELDFGLLREELSPAQLNVQLLQSNAVDRLTHLKRSDLGRQLSSSSHSMLKPSNADIALIIGDGLSAVAVQQHAANAAMGLIQELREYTFAPISIVRHARVAIQDEIGSLLSTKLAIMLLGERPGLASADSLGAYLVYAPKIGNTDADRNCVSNIRPDGLPLSAAVQLLAYLARNAITKKLSGVQLKDDRDLHALHNTSPTLHSK